MNFYIKIAIHHKKGSGHDSLPFLQPVEMTAYRVFYASEAQGCFSYLASKSRRAILPPQCDGKITVSSSSFARCKM